MEHKELIELYFEDKLSTEQKTVFENLLDTDQEFRAQFELEEQVKKAIISTKKDDLKERLKQIEHQHNMWILGYPSVPPCLPQGI